MNYESTLMQESNWSRFSDATRYWFMKITWGITEAGLIAGLFERMYWEWVVWFSIGHALVMLALVGWRPLIFPAQLRIAYAAWVGIGTFVPYMSWMMYVTTVGLGANLVVGYCPLSRMMYLLPWNRQESFRLNLLVRTFFSMPVAGRFQAPPSR